MASSSLRWGSTSSLLVICIVLAFMTTKAHAFGAGNIPSIGTLRLDLQDVQNDINANPIATAQVEGTNWRHGDIEE